MVKEDYYFGNPDQIRGVEECYLLEGKADGVRIMRVRNGLGLEVTVCPDRCADITRVIFKGDNMGYFALVVMFRPNIMMQINRNGAFFHRGLLDNLRFR